MIEDVITLALSRMQTSSCDDLTGFAIDAEFAFEELDKVFQAVDIRRTEDKRNLIVARLTVRPTIVLLQDVSQALRHAWTSIAYSDFDASAITHFQDATVLRFVTGIPGGALCVTGTILATGDTYERLAQRYNADYAAVVGRLVPMPGGLPRWPPN